MDSYKDIGPVDYDPFADEPQAAGPAAGDVIQERPPEPAPEPAEAKPEVKPKEKPKADYVVPPAPELPTVEFAGEPKKEEAKPTYKDVGPVDFDPFAEEKPVKEADSWVDPKDYAVVRGAAEGLQTLKGGADLLTVLDLTLGGKSDDERLKTILEQEPEQAPTGWERRVPSISGIRGVGDFATWFQESAGSAVTSTLPSVVGGAVGAAIGGAATVNPIGAAIGAAGGAALPSVALGISGMYQDLRSNEGVRKALQEGRLDVDTFQRLVYVGGVLQGALDAIPAGKFGKGAVDAIKHEIEQTFVKAAVKGAFEEGATESLQQAIDEGTQALGGGDTSLGQAALNIVDAGLQGMVGGIVFGGATHKPFHGVSTGGQEEPPKEDDQPGRAAPALPEGTPAETTPAAGEPTPGSESAGTPSQPAGTEKQPEEAPVENPVPPEDPRADDKPPSPAPTTTVTAPVETVGPGAVSSDIGAAISGAPVARPAPPAPAESGAAAARAEEPPEFNIRDTMPEETPEADIASAQSEQEARMKAMFAGDVAEENRQEALAAQTRVAPPGDEVAAALAPVPAQKETLGTGVTPIAGEQPSQAAANLPTAEEPQPSPVATEESPVQAPPAPAEAAPAVTPLTPVSPAGAVAQVETPAPAPETLAAFGTTPQIETAAPPVEAAAAPPAQAAPAPGVTVGPPQAVEPTRLPPKAAKAVEVSVKKARGVAKAARGEAAAKEAPTPQPEAKPAPAKAAAAKVVSKAKAGPEIITREQLLKEEAAKKKSLEEAAAARKAREEARPRLARDIHREAREQLRKALPDTSEGQLEQLIEEESDKAAKETTKERPAERIEEGVPKVVEAVKRRVAEAEKAEREAFVSEEEKQVKAEEEKAAEKEKRQEEEKAKRAEQAKAEVGQKKERAGKKKGLSAEGRRAQSHESLMGEYEKELGKKPENRNPLILAYGQEHQKQARLPKNPSEDKKAEVERQRQEHLDRKAQIKEALAVAAEQEEAGREGLSKERAAIRDRVKPALDANPAPEMTGRQQADDRSMLENLKAFKEATKGIPLADHVDRAHQSMEENLAIFARKVKEKTPTAADFEKDDGTMFPYHFAMARLFMNNGATKEFYDLVTSQKMEGAEYNEAKGEGDMARAQELSRAKQDTELTSKVRRQELSHEAMSAWSDVEALIRSGRRETRERAAARQTREEGAYKDFRPMEVTRPGTGEKVTVRAETRKGSDVLREINRMLSADRPRGFVSTIQNALIRHLTQMVGDIDVHFVSAKDMAQLHGKQGQAAGLYYNYSPTQRAQGMRPMVFLDEELALYPDAYAHTVLHEMTHASTSMALALDIRGTRRLITNLQGSLYRQMSNSEKAQFQNAFTNESEFVAEAMSNPDFQEMLATKQMPDAIAREISGVAADRKPTWWDAVVSMVSNAVGMLWGRRGQTYMEQVVKLYPSLAYSEQGQLRLAKEHAPGFPRSIPQHPVAAGAEALNLDFRQIFDGAKSRYSDATTPKYRRWRDIFSSSGEIWRRSADYFGGPDNPLAKLIELHNRRDQLRTDLRRNPGHGLHPEQTELAAAELQRTNKGAYNEMSDILHEMSRYALDATVGLNDPINGHIYKTGSRHRQVRAMHAQLEQRWNALPQAAKTVGKQVIEHYRAAAKMETQEMVRHTLDNAMQKYGATLPAGKTIDDAVQWVMSGHALRDAANQTQEDKDYHAALGNTAKTIASVPMVRAPKGVYVPFMRRGKYFISVTERPFGTMQNPTNLPAGAMMDAENRLVFKNEADYNAFADQHPTQVTGSTMYINPRTGAKTTSAPFADPNNPARLIIPRKVFVATIQNKRVEMADSQSYLVQRAKELDAQGHHASDVGITRKHLHQAVKQIAPAEVTRLIRNLEQTTIGQTTVGQEAVGNAVYDAYIRQLTSPGSLARGLRRSGTLGEDHDLVMSLRDYNRDFAHNIANMQLGSQLSRADTEVYKYISAKQHTESPGTGLTAIRQAMHDEVSQRITGWQGESNETTGMKVVNTIKNIAFLRHLFSPHYSIMNSMQPYMTTVPVLSSRHGIVSTQREMRRAYGLGRKQAIWSGIKQTAKAAVHVLGGQENFDNDAWWRNRVAGEADGSRLQQLFDYIRSLGWGASSGIEAPGISELDMNSFEKGVHRLVNIAKALPEAIEGINRYVTAIAAYRLAVKDGMSHEAAMKYAALTVEETQGGYGAANNPTFFQNPLLQPATQFRKYGLMYGQLFWRNLSWSFSKDPVQRKQAAKAVAGLAFTTTVLAGALGVPLVEPLRMLVNAAAAAGLSDDDWDDKEKALQKWLASMIQWASGSKSLGAALSEATLHGFTRLIDIDTSGMFGNDSLFLFGEPKSLDEEGIYAWLAKAMFGAAGGMGADAAKNFASGNYSEIIPWPKVIKNIQDAIKLKSEGVKSKLTGEQYHKPFSWYEAGVKAAGFRPAEESRPFEAGGSAAQRKEQKDMRGDRRTLMSRWRNASPSERQRIFREDVRQWNREHKNPDEKIQMQDLLRSVRSKKAEERRLKKAELYD